MEVIRSVSNPLVKEIAKRLRGREARSVLVEGRKNVADLLARGRAASLVIVTEEQAGDFVHEPGLRVVSDRVFRSLTAVRSPDGVLAFFEANSITLESMRLLTGPILALHSVQDPGNVGAILRVAAAFGAAGVVLGPGCASPLNPKTARGSAGAAATLAFRMTEDLAADLRALGASRPVVAAVARDGLPLPSARIPMDAVLLLGSEGAGLPDELLAFASLCVSIPISREIDSLNVAVAAGILLYSLRVTTQDVRPATSEPRMDTNRHE